MLRNLWVLTIVCVALSAAGCSSSEFSGGGSDKAGDAKKKDEPSKVDQAAKDDEQPAATDQAGKDDEAKNGDDEGEDEGKFAIISDEGQTKTNCKYFDDDDQSDKSKTVVEGGPELALRVNDYVRGQNGKLEGKTYKFRMSMWRSLYTDAIANTPAAGILGVGKLAGDWTPTKTYPEQVETWFDGEILNADRKSCKPRLKEVEKDLVTRLAENHAIHSDLHGGCFAPSTRIRMADGRDVPVTYLKVGDLILNPVTRKSMPIEKIETSLHFGGDMFEIGIGGKIATVTGGHPFATKAGLKAAKDLTKADLIYAADGKFHAIEVARPLKTAWVMPVYNFVLKTDSKEVDAHQLLADGVVAGDLYLQQTLGEGQTQKPKMEANTEAFGGSFVSR